ncbi:DUF5651 domain-containing protein [Aneurinibacillus thermoaerophilus]|uniref:DUF5651 domain-containing protein n=1 Tax=Aneurinibacillus thermoaerophilus TaxID=143495 RepID=UPI002E226B21|nr:DUF5651 domain-containing protein [Aneurinibacillus thermoaerophilus]
MGTGYLNRRERENVVSTLVATLHIDNLIESSSRIQNLFGTTGMANLKRGRTFILKALHEGLSKSLSQQENERIHRIAQTCDATVIERAGRQKNKNEKKVTVSESLFNDLAELAIGTQCRDCTKECWKECRVFEVLQVADIPAANINTGDCPYRQ